MNNIYDVIVIGGGISGTSFAYYAKKLNRKVLLVEKQNKLGGVINSLPYKDDFFLEMGAHTCYNSYSTVISLLEELRLRQYVVARKKLPFKFFKERKLQSMYTQIHWLNFLVSFPNFFTYKKSTKSVRQYYCKVLGKKNYYNFVKKLFSAVICQNPDNYPAELFLKIRSRRNKIYPPSFSFSKSIYQLIESMQNSISVVTKKEVQKIKLEKGNYIISLSNGERLSAKNIAIATNPQVASSLILPIHPTLSSILVKIKTTEVESVGFLCRNEDSKLPLVSGIIPYDSSFLSMVSSDIIPHNIYRGFTFHFNSNTPFTNKTDEKILDILKIKKEKIIAAKNVKIKLPVLKKGHVETVSQLSKKLNEVTGLFLLGNYFYGLSMEDCLIRTKKEINRLNNSTL